MERLSLEEEAAVMQLLEQHNIEISSMLASLETKPVSEPVKPVPVIHSGKCADYGIANEYKDLFHENTFTDWLKTNPKRPALFHHLENIVVGDVILFASQKDGLYADIELHDTPAGRDINLLIKEGVINALSTYYIHVNTGNPLNDNTLERTINWIKDVPEVSFVLRPSGQKTLLDGSGRTFKEGLWSEYLKRLEKGYWIEHRLKVPEIREIVVKEYHRIKHIAKNSTNNII